MFETILILSIFSIFSDVLENFVLLQTLKYNYHEQLNSVANDLHNDVEDLKKLINKSMKATHSFPRTDNMFRANHIK